MYGNCKLCILKNIGSNSHIALFTKLPWCLIMMLWLKMDIFSFIPGHIDRTHTLQEQEKRFLSFTLVLGMIKHMN